jgi:hypothetical protein
MAKDGLMTGDYDVFPWKRYTKSYMRLALLMELKRGKFVKVGKNA